MKTINKVCQILALVAGVAAVILFFTDFATIVSNGTTVISASGAQLCFGAKAGDFDLYKSSTLLFVFLVTVLSAVFAGFSFKANAAKWGAAVSSGVAAVYMLVIYLSSAVKFVDFRPIPNVTSVTYTATVLVTVIVLFAAFALSVAHLLINDRIVCGDKKATIPQRVVRFFKDYKSESKKIVWPTLKDVAKNTLIVLIMCAILGAFIWLLDFGLVSLVNLLWK